MSFNCSVTSGKELSGLSSEFRLQIASSGVVSWNPGIQLESSCQLDLTYFPFDNQTCEITFGSWMYPIQQVNFSILIPGVWMGYYKVCVIIITFEYHS